MRSKILFLTGFLAAAFSAALLAYPLDGYEETGIRRVEGARLEHGAGDRLGKHR